MTQVYFHCSNTKKVFVDSRGAVVDDLAEARDHATLSTLPVQQSLLQHRNVVSRPKDRNESISEIVFHGC